MKERCVFRSGAMSSGAWLVASLLALVCSAASCSLPGGNCTLDPRPVDLPSSNCNDSLAFEAPSSGGSEDHPVGDSQGAGGSAGLSSGNGGFGAAGTGGDSEPYLQEAGGQSMGDSSSPSTSADAGVPQKPPVDAGLGTDAGESGDAGVDSDATLGADAAP